MIPETEALEIVAKHGQDCIIIPTFVATAWPESPSNQLELPFIGCMSKGSSFALGLALARPDKKIVLLDGDGSLLMNLGTLVTITHMAPPNLVYFVIENSVYQTTGGQLIPGAEKISFSGFARAAGFANVYEFDESSEFQKQIEGILSLAGPTFVSLKVTRDGKRRPITRLLHMALPQFKAELAKSLPQA